MRNCRSRRYVNNSLNNTTSVRGDPSGSCVERRYENRKANWEPSESRELVLRSAVATLCWRAPRFVRRLLAGPVNVSVGEGAAFR